jgi:hypothetical protein
MKIKMTILVLLSLAATAMGGDAAMKRQLVGTWTAASDGGTIILTPDGRLLSGDTVQEANQDSHPERWDVRGRNFIEIRPSPESDRDYTIISLTKHKCVIQENAHGRNIAIWTR